MTCPQQIERRERRVPLLVGLAALLAAGLFSGCGMVKRVAEVPQKTIGVVVPGKGGDKTNPADLQQQLMSLADDATLRTAQAIDEHVAALGTPAAETEGLHWKLSTGTMMMLLATGPNPQANLVDALASTTLRRLELEALEAQGRLPPSLNRLLDLSRIFETSAWKLAEDVLSPTLRDELRQRIEEWHQSHPLSGSLALARPQEFALELRRQAQTRSSGSGGIASLLTLDPLLGLDPAIREVTQTRLFAERAMYTLQRMPNLLRWQTELLTRETLQLPEMQAVVTNAAALSATADRVSRTAAELPAWVSAEREQILAELEAQEGKLRELVSDVRLALLAGQGMSSALGQTLLTFDALMKRFGVGEPEPSGQAPPPPDRHPFDIRDYATTARDITAMAAQLEATIQDLTSALDSPALTRRKEELETLATQLEGRVRRQLHHAFLLVAALVVLGFVCAFTYRWAVARWATAGRPPRSGQ